MTVGVLAPYRRQGLASKLVQQVISAAEATHRPPVADVYPIKAKEGDKKKGAASTVAAAKKAIVTELYLHVQTSNDESRLFWEGHGFQVTVRRHVCILVAFYLTLGTIAGNCQGLLSQN